MAAPLHALTAPRACAGLLALLGALCPACGDGAGAPDGAPTPYDAQPADAWPVSTDGAIPDAPTGPPVDASAPDAAAPDAGALDAAVPDAAPPIDAAVPDATPIIDASVPDARPPDAAPIDAAVPDARAPDASPPDAGAPDAPSVDAGPPRECFVPITHPTIQAAVSDASCNPIYVDSGTYVENVVIPRSVAIIGPTPPASPAIVDGGGSGTVIRIEASTVVELSYLTIQNGTGSESVGAGIDTSGVLWLRNSSVVMNSGRGIAKQPWFPDHGEVHVIDSLIAGNTSMAIWGNDPGIIEVRASEISDNGAGIVAMYGTDVSVTEGSVLRDNAGVAVGGYDPEGTSLFSIRDTIIEGNGWGVSAVGPSVMITRTRIANSTAGAGLRIEYAYILAPVGATVTDSEIVGNQGGVTIDLANSAPLTIRIERSLIANNAGDGTGNGVHISTGTWRAELQIINTTITGNARGVFAYKAQENANAIYLSNATITNNHAPSGSGGGIYAYGAWPFDGPTPGSQVVHIHNSIVAGNTAAGVPDDCATVDDALVETNGFNVLGAFGGCIISAPLGDVVGEDPWLGPLADNGGPTFTHALLPGSPALDAGDDAGCAERDGTLISDDQRGQPRPVGAGCDVGAYEVGP